MLEELIEKEIVWCNQHQGESGKGKEFEAAFIKGLEQALHIAREYRGCEATTQT